MSDRRVVLITGVTRGLGRAMAHRFAEFGHTVVGCGRTQSAARELGDQLGPAHRINTLDVAHEGEVANWASQVLERFGPPDLLLNNAAVINCNAPLWAVPAAEFSAVVEVNIIGVANVIRHFVPAMIERGTGVIVNFSSGWGRYTAAEVAPYCATKFAIEGMTQALAQEIPSSLAAIPLNPGIINTEMLQSCFGSSADTFPTAREWAESAVPFLLRLGPDENGQSLTVTG